MDKSDLLSYMREGRATLEGVLAQIRPEKMQVVALYGTWSVKDLMAHLSFWEERAAVIYQHLIKGTKPEPPGGADISLDELNARVYQTNHDRPLEQVRRDEKAAYEGLVTMVEKAEPADLFDGTRFDWTQGKPFYEWVVSNSIGHYEEHLPALKEWIKTHG